MGRKLVGLVGCCGPKLSRPAPAEKQYQSTLFKLCMGVAKQDCDSWVILSAKLRVVLPTDVIEPYEFVLPDTGPILDEWVRQTRKQLLSIYDPEKTRFVIYCGKTYAKAVEGLKTREPMKGMKFGHRLQWLKAQLESNTEGFF